MSGFAERFPLLWHVADAAAVPGIRRHGLLSAAALCQAHGVSLPAGNRAEYTPVAPGAALRWQGMWDRALATRLAPGLDPDGWRRLINAKVFLFASVRDAGRLRTREAARDQVVLEYETAALLDAGLDVKACRFNNGYIDRSAPSRRRLRGPDDYVPVAAWPARTVPREVTVEGGIPPGVSFQQRPAGQAGAA